MLRQQPIVDRLAAAGFASVQGVLEFAALSEAPRMSPALFVVPRRMSAAPNRMGAGVIDQKLGEAFQVVLVVNSTRLAAKVSDDLHVHCSAIETALTGWRHPDCSGPCELAGGELLSVEGQRVAWAISFNASRHLRKESQ